MTLRDPAAIEAFLLSQGVHYIALPSWAVMGGLLCSPSCHAPHAAVPVPGHGSVPGGICVPLSGSDLSKFSLVHSVADAGQKPSIELFPGGAEPEPALVNPAFTVPSGATDPRIFVPMNPDAPPATLEFEYRGSGAHAVQFNRFDPATLSWDVSFLRLHRPGGPDR